MKRSAPPLQFLASAAMSSRSSYRGGGGGGRKQRGRGFSDRPYNQGRGDQQFVTGDSHFRSGNDNSNLGTRNGGADPRRLPRPPPRYNPNQHFRQPPQPFLQNQNSQFRPSPRFDQNNQAFRPPQQFRRRPPKPLDCRDWEYARTRPPPNCEKFIVLSYNILADYLALNHRSKLYFHIPRYMLDWEWRKRSILFELNLWSADIMCFQEVDRFQDLAEELKHRGYNGIWKMRTGNAVDGCAIFWRTSRFKLLYEEYIEFNKLGLRDNVAQICVLEQLTNKNWGADTLDLPTSSGSSDKVVVCNIHVLYNPRRGEIKLGQVRTLLDKAYAVSKMWNAPVVLCGDFNCTPKSPLYNFITEQKLELSGIDRDKVSGQASAEIRPRPCNSNPNYNPNANTIPHGTSSSEKSHQASIAADNEVNNYLMDMQKQNNPDRNKEIIPTTDNNHLLQSTRTLPDASDASNSTAICVEKTKSTQQDAIDNCREGTLSTISVLTDHFHKDLTISRNECELPIGQMNEVNCELTSTISSHIEDSNPDNNQMQQLKSACPDQGSFYEHLGVIDYIENKDPTIDNLAQPIELSPIESSGYMSSHQTGIDDNADQLAPSEAKITSISPSIYCEGEKKLDDASSPEMNFLLEGEMVIEHQDAFLSELHNTQFSSQGDFGRIGQSDFIASQNELDSEVDSPSNEVLNDLSHDLSSGSITVDRAAYDPSLWTPMEVAIATGNADSMFLEHPLKLKSTYTEAEDQSGTRDPNGEPLVTSYNRCFLGTVDYIWSSEGLQTVRVLVPMPKHVMQRTPGFPTKKWGSDHIALASELAFTKDATNKRIEVQHHKD